MSIRWLYVVIPQYNTLLSAGYDSLCHIARLHPPILCHPHAILMIADALDSLVERADPQSSCF